MSTIVACIQLLQDENSQLKNENQLLKEKILELTTPKPKKPISPEKQALKDSKEAEKQLQKDTKLLHKESAKAEKQLQKEASKPQKNYITSDTLTAEAKAIEDEAKRLKQIAKGKRLAAGNAEQREGNQLLVGLD